MNFKKPIRKLYTSPTLSANLRESRSRCRYGASLAAYAENALEGTERARLEVHLKTCPTCRTELLMLSSIGAILRNHAPGVVEPSPYLRQNVLSQITKSPNRFPHHSRYAVRTIAPVLATFLLGSLGVLIFHRTEPSNSTRVAKISSPDKGSHFGEKPNLLAMVKASNSSPAERGAEAKFGAVSVAQAPKLPATQSLQAFEPGETMPTDPFHREGHLAVVKITRHPAIGDDRIDASGSDSFRSDSSAEVATESVQNMERQSRYIPSRRMVQRVAYAVSFERDRDTLTQESPKVAMVGIAKPKPVSELSSAALPPDGADDSGSTRRMVSVVSNAEPTQRRNTDDVSASRSPVDAVTEAKRSSSMFTNLQ